MRIIGQDSATHTGKRVVVVYDHDKGELGPVLLSASRLNSISEFMERNFDRILSPSVVASDIGRHVTAADANEAYAFLVGQLTYTEAYVPAKLYLPMQYKELLPISNEAGPWADSIRYEKVNQVGQADWISDKGDDIPTVDVEYDETIRQICHAGVAYEYSLQELRQTAYLRRPLNERKMVVAMEASERFLNKVAIQGDTRKNMLGFLNQSAASQIAVGGTGGTTLTGTWDGVGTPDQILADLNFGLNKIYTDTAYNMVVTDIRVPAAAWTRFTATARTAYNDTTILEFLLRNNISRAVQNVELKIGPCFKSETAGAATTGGAVSGSNSRAVFYVKRPEVLRFHIPMPLQFQAPQLYDLKVRVPGELRCGGLELTYPKAMFYMDKVLTAG